MPRSASIKAKIGVVGTINRDTIFLPGDKVIESWGGLLYSIKYVSDHAGCMVLPVVNVGTDAYRQVMTILSRFDRLDASQIRKVAEKNNHCFLHYHDQSHKCEILKGGVPPLTFGRLKPLLGCDLVIVNFISGSDVRLAALEEFRSRFSGLIYMDIHSHTLGRRKVPGGYRRHLRRPPHWERYVAVADILQMNEVEFRLLSDFDVTRQNVMDFYEKHTQQMKCLVVTIGADGCLVAYGRRKGGIKTRRMPAKKIGRVRDTTGCGDIFGAGFAVKYLHTKNPLEASRHGAELAARRCTLKGKMF